jgi:uncharacterized membrane protein
MTRDERMQKLVRATLVALVLSLAVVMPLLLWRHELFREVTIYGIFAGCVIIALVCFHPENVSSTRTAKTATKTPS